MGILHDDQYTFFTIPHSLLLRMTNVSDKSCREHQNTHFMLNNFFKNCVFYAITWKKFVEPGRPQIKTWHMHIACWIPKTTNTLPEYGIVTDFALQQWLHKHNSVLRYTYTACLV